MNVPTLADIKLAARRIAPFVHKTPIFTSLTIDRFVDGEVFFKCENLQKTGAFKIRGATNAVFSLSSEQAVRGVATHSSGNHAAALAQAAHWRGITSTVVMPCNAPLVKQRAVAGYGAEVTLCEPTLQARETTLAKVVERTGATFIPPYNDYRIIAGQATAALELCAEVTDLDVVMAPVGGGGLLSGSVLAARALIPGIRVLGVEPADVDDAFRSFRAGYIIPMVKPDSIADGLLTSLGTLTFPIIKEYVHDIVTVSEEAIVSAMRLLWERMKLVVEPSAAVPLAALITHRIELSGQRIGIILSGGNVDLDDLPW